MRKPSSKRPRDMMSAATLNEGLNEGLSSSNPPTSLSFTRFLMFYGHGKNCTGNRPTDTHIHYYYYYYYYY